MRLLFAGLFLLARLSAATAAEDRVEFGSDIRPILAENCFACHGPDDGQREADLRLDTQAAATSQDHGAIVPGDLEASEAWQRIISDDPDLQMPPPDSGKELTGTQRELIRRWIEQGAKWSQHWSFVAPVRPDVPATRNSAWVKNPIDAFVLQRLEQAGLHPSSEAVRTTWLRRVALDLIGLPPGPDEVDAFVADESGDAHDKVIDRLLESKHYGERWGRIWLDAARYADSDGYEKDKPREVWFYRDWVIDALNGDMPYDQFIIEQVAGDLLPNAGQNERVATGFLRNSMINEEGGVDPEQFRMEAMFDRMDAIGKSVLGLTINCGQCHSHKYDPLTQEEYYRMFAFLNNSYEAQPAVYTREEQEQIAALRAATTEIDELLQRGHPGWQADFAKWQDAQNQLRQPTWQPCDLEFDDTTIGGQKFLPQTDRSYLAQGYAPTKFRPQMTLQTDLSRVTGIRLELLTDPNLPRGGPGRSLEGTCGLTEFEVEWAPQSDPGKVARVKIASATADVQPVRQPLKEVYSDRSEKQRVTGPVEYAIDGDPLTAWTTDIGYGRSNVSRTAVFAFDKPLELSEPTFIHIFLSQQHGGWNSDDNQTFNIGKFRISLTSDDDPKSHPLPPSVREICEIPPDLRTQEQTARLFACWRATVPEWSKENGKVEELWAKHPPGATQLVLQERAQPRVTSLLNRGDFLSPRYEVEPAVPGFLHAMSASTAGPPRLAFAQWLVDRRAPTTARSIVNRIWQAYFGSGLVETADDLGTQGTPPSHPELLDWLTVELMENDWSLKHLHRLITSSATYRQSSHVTTELYAQDPYNRLLARGPRFRVDAEIVRDITLAASGLLNCTIGGPSVYPPAPDFLFKPPASYGPKTWNEAHDDNRYRRGLYTFRFRSVPYPMLETFDAPPGNVSCVRRSRSNTPLQSLTSLNEPLFIECARRWPS